MRMSLHLFVLPASISRVISCSSRVDTRGRVRRPVIFSIALAACRLRNDVRTCRMPCVCVCVCFFLISDSHLPFYFLSRRATSTSGCRGFLRRARRASLSPSSTRTHAPSMKASVAAPRSPVSRQIHYFESRRVFRNCGNCRGLFLINTWFGFDGDLIDFLHFTQRRLLLIVAASQRRERERARRSAPIARKS